MSTNEQAHVGKKDKDKDAGFKEEEEDIRVGLKDQDKHAGIDDKGHIRRNRSQEQHVPTYRS